MAVGLLLPIDVHMDVWIVLQQSIQKCSIFCVTQTQIVTICILYQIKGMNLRNMNIGDAIVRQLNESGELTLSVPWWNI